MSKQVLRFLLLALMVPLLSTCWLPNRFGALVKIMKDGTFTVQFEGTIDYAPLVYDIKTKNLPVDEQSTKMAVLERDLRRDTGFQQVTPQGNGRFDVKYRHDDKIDGTFLYTFVRRDAAIMKVLVGKDGRASIWFSTLSQDDAKRATDLGLSIEGLVKVLSDLPVLDNNAQQTAKYGTTTVYQWRVNRYDQTPAPHIVFKMF